MSDDMGMAEEAMNDAIVESAGHGDDMSDNYEAWISAELAFRKRAVLNRIDEIEYILDGLRQRVIDDSYLNELGELQQAGPMLDSAIAAYAVQRQTLKNYKEMVK